MGNHLDLMVLEAAKAADMKVRSSMEKLGGWLGENASKVGWLDLHHDVIYDREELGYAMELYNLMGVKAPPELLARITELDVALREFLPTVLPAVRRALDFRPIESQDYPGSFWWIPMLS